MLCTLWFHDSCTPCLLSWVHGALGHTPSNKYAYWCPCSDATLLLPLVLPPRQAGREGSRRQATPHSKVAGHAPHVMVVLAWACQEPLGKHKSLCGDEVWNGGAIASKMQNAYKISGRVFSVQAPPGWHIRMYVCMYVCMYVSMYIYIYI